MFVDYKGDYMFHETLSASPQCFKVYFRNDKDMKTQIAEVRVSRGVIRCYVPDVSGKEIFKKDMKHELSAFKD